MLGQRLRLFQSRLSFGAGFGGCEPRRSGRWPRSRVGMARCAWSRGPPHSARGRLPASSFRSSIGLVSCSQILRVKRREQAICCLHCPRIAAGGRGRASRDQNRDRGRSLGLTLRVRVWESVQLVHSLLRWPTWAPRAGTRSRGRGWSTPSWPFCAPGANIIPILQVRKLRHREGEGP